MKFFLFMASLVPILLVGEFPVPLWAFHTYMIVPLFMAILWAKSLENKALAMDDASQRTKFLRKRVIFCVVAIFTFGTWFTVLHGVHDSIYDYGLYSLAFSILYLTIAFIFAMFAIVWVGTAMNFETEKDRVTGPFAQTGIMLIYWSIPISYLIAAASGEMSRLFFGSIIFFFLGKIMNSFFYAETSDKRPFRTDKFLASINQGTIHFHKFKKEEDKKRMDELERNEGSLTDTERAELSALRNG